MEMRQIHYLPPTPGCFSISVGILAVAPARRIARARQSWSMIRKMPVPGLDPGMEIGFPDHAPSKC
jgi:hypothetical protein